MDNSGLAVELRLGPTETTLLAPRQSWVLALGTQRTADEWFAHSPPTPGELENAIMAVEDQLARARALAGSAMALYGDDAVLRQIARFAGVAASSAAQPERLPLSVEAVENAFERLALAAEGGRSAQSAGLPAGEAGRTFAAALLIVRELMHHLGFARLDVGT